MVGWNDLPEKSKKEVVKRLDFMSRCSMRSTCRADRQIVDSTELYIPRLRVAFKDGYTSATIYTGIGQFLKVDFVACDGGALVYRMENEMNRTSNTAAKRIKGIHASRLFGVFLRHQFIRPNVLIGTLEFEHFIADQTSQNLCTVLLMRSFGEGKVFRAKKLVTNCITKKLTDIFLYNNLVDKTVLEEMSNDGVHLSAESAHCMKMIDTTVFPDPQMDPMRKCTGDKDGTTLIDLEPIQKYVNVPHYESYIYTREYRFEAPTAMHKKVEDTEGFVTCRFGDTSDKDLWDHQHLKVEKLNEHVLMKRISMFGQVYRWNKSKCGNWTHACKAENEHKFVEFFKNEKCGLRWFCKTCTDPFDYWYYRNYPKRILDEPEPGNIVINFHSENEYGEDVRREVKLFQEKFKSQKLGRNTARIQSWGFKKREGRVRTSNVRFQHLVDFEDGDIFKSQGKTLGFDHGGDYVMRTFWMDKPNYPTMKPNDTIFGVPVVNVAKYEAENGLLSRINKKLGSWSPFKGDSAEKFNLAANFPPIAQEGKMTVEEYAAWLTNPKGPARKFSFETDENGETVVNWEFKDKTEDEWTAEKIQTLFRFAQEHSVKRNGKQSTVVEID